MSSKEAELYMPEGASVEGPHDRAIIEAGEALESAWSPRPSTLSDAVAEALVDLGVRHAFGLIGGAVAPFAEALGRSPMEVIHCRHEGGAAFAATEAYFASGRPSLVFTTTGPGILNAMTGMAAAWWEGAKVVLVSGATPAPQRGRWACQETSTYTMPGSGVTTSGAPLHYAVTIEDVSELDEVLHRLAAGFARPNGFVAHIGIPLNAQKAPVPTRRRSLVGSMHAAGSEPHVVDECVRLLTAAPPVIWVGFGAREAGPQVLALARRTGATVISSPRGKGVFPETHPQFLGVTGLGGYGGVEAHLASHRPDHVLVLGSRLGELTSFWRPEFVPTRSFVHVDLDPSVPGTAYPSVPTVGIQAEIGAFLDAVLARIPALSVNSAPDFRASSGVAPVIPRTEGPVRPQALMDALQRVVVDGSDAVLMTEAGNALTWGNHLLRFRSPGRYRVSTGFGSMGHAAAGVVGAALGRGGKAFAVLGDGAMLMNSEVSTAVARRAHAVWVVLNDSQYGMIEQGMRAWGLQPVATAIPSTDFAMLARALGAEGVRVERETDLDAALLEALRSPRPFVVDVCIDRREIAPSLARINSLVKQENPS